MPANHRATPGRAGESQDAQPDDKSLIQAAAGGSDAALRMLMDRYDRLVRYTIFRTARRECLRDPHWLETVAVDSWRGFLKTLQRDSAELPGNAATYLSGIARNQAISALRRRSPDDLVALASGSLIDAKSSQADPGQLLAELESLESLRSCLASLPEEDQVIVSQLSAITQRQWVQAGKALGMTESTLRSRWSRILERLRRCLHENAG